MCACVANLATDDKTFSERVCDIMLLTCQQASLRGGKETQPGLAELGVEIWPAGDRARIWDERGRNVALRGSNDRFCLIKRRRNVGCDFREGVKSQGVATHGNARRKHPQAVGAAAGGV